MTFWDDLQLGHGHRRGSLADDGHTQAGLTPQRLTFVDFALLAGLAAIAFFALDDFLRGDQSSGLERPAPIPQRQQVCTDQELRHMRSGIDGCFDSLGPAPREPGYEPALKSLQSS